MKNIGLRKAIELLQNQMGVVPEKYTMYNGAFLFLAYPKGVKNKDECMNVHYLVDLKQKAVGPFSPAFDLDGFFKAANNFKDV